MRLEGAKSARHRKKMLQTHAQATACFPAHDSILKVGLNHWTCQKLCRSIYIASAAHRLWIALGKSVSYSNFNFKLRGVLEHPEPLAGYAMHCIIRTYWGLTNKCTVLNKTLNNQTLQTTFLLAQLYNKMIDNVLCVLFKLKSNVSEVVDDLHWDTAGIVGAEGDHSGRLRLLHLQTQGRHLIKR